MNKLLITFLLTVLTFSVNARTISFVTNATYPPFESADDHGHIVGFDIDLANAVCAELQATCTFVDQSFDSLIPSLKFKRFDAVIAAMDVTEERAKQVAFTKPYYESKARYITLAKNNISSVDELKTIGVQNGTTFERYVLDKTSGYELKAYDALQKAVHDLKSGRINAVFGDADVLTFWQQNDPELAFVGDVVKDQEYFGVGFSIAVNLNNKELLNEFNLALDKIKASDDYQILIEKWFN